MSQLLQQMDKKMMWRCSILTLFVISLLGIRGPIVHEVHAEQSLAQHHKCGIENCHGLDIECGPHVPQVCTEIYKLGDFCRKYVHCALVDGKCQLLEDDRFTECVTCVRECEKTKDMMQAFECEQACREQID